MLVVEEPAAPEPMNKDEEMEVDDDFEEIISEDEKYDDNFEYKMIEIERAAWASFEEVSQNFLGNTKSENYVNLVEELYNYDTLGCLMNSKLHYLHSHLSHFPENPGDYSE
ncbi:unnamed protein product [Psylliodes chrysocephalus]|uniref:Uncharacterized protein n=1 Tax=Psylliodes chrysocephalus TaxID=3402493 RepID=A0A9P0DDM6_9CUCU|nr:unnamed protein product [Psylliodes chrysocephala]